MNLSLERGQIDSIFRLNFTDPWIDGDNKRTSRTVMVQVYSFNMNRFPFLVASFIHMFIVISRARTQGLLEHLSMVAIILTMGL